MQSGVTTQRTETAEVENVENVEVERAEMERAEMERAEMEEAEMEVVEMEEGRAVVVRAVCVCDSRMHTPLGALLQVLLLQHKADPNARNAALQLPLELALTHFFHQGTPNLP